MSIYGSVVTTVCSTLSSCPLYKLPHSGPASYGEGKRPFSPPISFFLVPYVLFVVFFYVFLISSCFFFLAALPFISHPHVVLGLRLGSGVYWGKTFGIGGTGPGISQESKKKKRKWKEKQKEITVLTHITEHINLPLCAFLKCLHYGSVCNNTASASRSGCQKKKNPHSWGTGQRGLFGFIWY